MLGVAANRAQLTPEIFGWNLNGPHADVDGIHREGEIEPDEPFYRTSTLWDPRTLSRWILAGVSGVSGSPGNYLCNYSLYRALGALPGTKVGFLHVPGDAHIEREVMLDKVKTICHDVQ
jgi:pyrrolidone-carboxylate peptidase